MYYYTEKCFLDHDMQMKILFALQVNQYIANQTEIPYFFFRWVYFYFTVLDDMN